MTHTCFYYCVHCRMQTTEAHHHENGGDFEYLEHVVGSFTDIAQRMLNGWPNNDAEFDKAFEDLEALLVSLRLA